MASQAGLRVTCLVRCAQLRCSGAPWIAQEASAFDISGERDGTLTIKRASGSSFTETITSPTSARRSTKHSPSWASLTDAGRSAWRLQQGDAVVPEDCGMFTLYPNAVPNAQAQGATKPRFLAGGWEIGWQPGELMQLSEIPVDRRLALLCEVVELRALHSAVQRSLKCIGRRAPHSH
ncbi:hypothetical protein BV20DRAFT_776266 [Pilatotrama ljubarskyi]|nr:hypothetical protein BV20DRAFT_776266 [Pilatotrama ljubarskyi]